MWTNLLAWIGDHRVGDLASIAGVIISIVGFALTVHSSVRSKRAAERAEIAAKEARENIRLLETVTDFTAVISILEEVKRAHRGGQWAALPDRYAAIRKILINVRTTKPDLSTSHKAALQSAIVNLVDFEGRVEKFLANPGTINSAKLNATLSRDVDNLVEVLAEIKLATTGG